VSIESIDLRPSSRSNYSADYEAGNIVHSGDLWELHRNSGAGRLVRLLDVISRYGVEPINGFAVQMVPQIRFNYGPPPQ